MSQSGSPASQPEQGQGQPPLVIVSQDGRNTEASRRIVRAQAARASAAQSRVTRARNREEREGVLRDAYQPMTPNDTNQPGRPVQRSNDGRDEAPGHTPLLVWLSQVVLPAAASIDQGVRAAIAERSMETSLSNVSSDGQVDSDGRRTATSSGMKLPLATPKGFASLQHRIMVPDALLSMLSRAACIDFASPGVRDRLHDLLTDLIVYTAATQSSHPVQCHLRVACACLTIFQGQRANDAVFANDERYQGGLAAAWSEATMLDINALCEPQAAEASLWAIFVISVTTGSTKDFFHKTLQTLLHDLQLDYWEQVRKVLLDFIYPVSFLDEPSKVFYQGL